MQAARNSAPLLGLATLAALGLAAARPADAQAYSYHEITSALLGTPTLSPDNSYLDADGITNAGVVVGQVVVAPPLASGASPTEGYEYDPKSGATTLINYQASSGGPGIIGVSGDGSKILGYYVGGDGNATYFTDSNGSITDLPAPYGQPGSGGPENFADYEGINSSGETVGTYNDGTEGYNHNGFLRSPDGTFTSLVDPDATSENPDRRHGTSATGINASGTIVGGYPYAFITGTDGRPAQLDSGFIRSADGTYTNFVLPDNDNSKLLGISDNGNLIGQYVEDKNDNVFGYFVDVDGKITEGINVPGSLDQSTFLTGINNSGQISGYFQDAGGDYHGFYANPVPEASSVISFGLLLSLGLGGLAIARKKSRCVVAAKP